MLCSGTKIKPPFVMTFYRYIVITNIENSIITDGAGVVAKTVFIAREIEYIAVSGDMPVAPTGDVKP